MGSSASWINPQSRRRAKSREVGTWLSLGRNTIRIVVEDWEPKQMYSASEGYVSVRKPANAIDRVTFDSVSTVTLQDTTLGGSTNCRRT